MLAVAERDRRQRARGVAGVDAGLLDVLHDAAEVELGAVVERVDVDLDRVVEEAVDEHGVLGLIASVARVDVVAQHRLVVDDLHAAAAEHVGRAHEHRVADRRRRSRRPRRTTWPCRARARAARPRRGPGRTRRAPRRGRSPRARADDRHAVVLERLREPERRLAAELHDDAGDRADGELGVEDLEHVLERERLEVEAVARVVVGRDRLGVAVDHDRLVADLAQREAACTHE